jgi:hypothetical protein
VQKLTVREAAEHLGISEDAVRKRIQRGTLAHRKSSDGHMYVYLDAQRDASVRAGEQGAPGQTTRTLFDYFPHVVSVAAVGGAIYVIGLVALWAPIAWSYTHDFATAWHAVSLVPTTTVAGQGVRYLLGPALLWTVIGTAYMAGVGALQRGTEKRLEKEKRVPEVSETAPHESKGERRRSRINKISLLALIVFIAIVVFYRVVLPWAYPLVREGYVLVREGYVLYVNKGISGLLKDRDTALAILGLANVVFGAVFILLYDRLILRKRNETERSIWKAWRLYEVASALFVITLLNILAQSTFTQKPPLPTAEITGSSETQGKLLTHTEGFWYVFSREGELIAISDDEVKTVHVLRQKNK